MADLKKELVAFGNYLLSEERRKLFESHPELIGSLEERLSVVHHSDVENFISNRKVKTENLTFGEAIDALKEGNKVARGGWNGKGMFLYHVPENSYPAITDIAKETFPSGQVPYGAYIAMKTAQDNVVPWLASQTDVLAEDWVISN